MMLEGIFVEQIMTHEYIRPYPQTPQETSGVTLGSQAIYRYSLKESDYPTLILPTPLYDGCGGVIKEGYYELALSDSKEFLILLESKNPRAILPVIKIEEDATEYERLNNKKVKKENKNVTKLRKNTNEKREKVGMSSDEEKIFSEATIEFNPKGEYYTVKYQRGTIKAWSIFKG